MGNWALQTLGWPGGDPYALDAAAGAWNDLSNALYAIAADTKAATSDLTHGWSGASATEFQERLEKFAGDITSCADHVNKFAHQYYTMSVHLDTAHRDYQDAVAVMALVTTAGILLTVFTLGASDGVAAGADAAIAGGVTTVMGWVLGDIVVSETVIDVIAGFLSQFVISFALGLVNSTLTNVLEGNAWDDHDNIWQMLADSAISAGVGTGSAFESESGVLQGLSGSLGGSILIGGATGLLGGGLTDLANAEMGDGDEITILGLLDSTVSGGVEGGSDFNSDSSSEPTTSTDPTTPSDLTTTGVTDSNLNASPSGTDTATPSTATSGSDGVPVGAKDAGTTSGTDANSTTTSQSVTDPSSQSSSAKDSSSNASGDDAPKTPEPDNTESSTKSPEVKYGLKDLDGSSTPDGDDHGDRRDPTIPDLPFDHSRVTNT